MVRSQIHLPNFDDYKHMDFTVTYIDLQLQLFVTKKVRILNGQWEEILENFLVFNENSSVTLSDSAGIRCLVLGSKGQQMH